MKLFKIYIILFAIVLAFVVGSRFFSPAYMVKETIIVNKPLDGTFAYMSNLKNWEEWSLWNKSLDSTLVYFYNNIRDTTGAIQYISGERIGKGRFKIMSFNRNKDFAYNLSMREGEITANGTFTFNAISDSQTEIAWLDSGNVGNNPIKRYMIPFKTESTKTSFKQQLERIKAAAEKH
jgi:hypothetical protein